MTGIPFPPTQVSQCLRLDMRNIIAHIFNLSNKAFQGNPMRTVIHRNKADCNIWIKSNMLQFQRR